MYNTEFVGFLFLNKKRTKQTPNIYHMCYIDYSEDQGHIASV